MATAFGNHTASTSTVIHGHDQYVQSTRLRVPEYRDQRETFESLNRSGNESGISEALVGDIVSQILKLIFRIEELSALPPDWDSYGAKVLSGAARRSAIVLLANLAAQYGEQLAEVVQVFPVPTGGIQFEWEIEDRGIEVEFEINPEGTVHLLLCTDGAEDIEPPRNQPFSIDDALAFVQESASRH